MKQSKQKICTCKQCNVQFDKKEVERVYGKESSIIFLNLCSARCYTDYISDLEEKPNNRQKAIEWWENLPLTEQQNKMYYFCTGVEKGAFEFTEDDIELIWKKDTNQ